ncbi:hypothetical protein K438DRAFT_1925292 [Mycena galopus ATCC 62051]|nr:hypothetical protein K438DRAFT_1925292 [Mycena galopus ATCC 62051]
MPSIDKRCGRQAEFETLLVSYHHHRSTPVPVFDLSALLPLLDISFQSCSVYTPPPWKEIFMSLADLLICCSLPASHGFRRRTMFFPNSTSLPHIIFDDRRPFETIQLHPHVPDFSCDALSRLYPTRSGSMSQFIDGFLNEARCLDLDAFPLQHRYPPQPDPPMRVDMCDFVLTWVYMIILTILGFANLVGCRWAPRRVLEWYFGRASTY